MRRLLRGHSRDLLAILGGGVVGKNAAQIAADRHRLGLDRPFAYQYASWLKRSLTLDLGESFQYKRPVLDLVRERARTAAESTAKLLRAADVDFAILGPREACTGDPARRMGNEFVFQQLAMENVETLNAAFEGRVPGMRKIVATCPHCFNSLGKEYPQLGGEYEVVHHTQLLDRLVAEAHIGLELPVRRLNAVHIEVARQARYDGLTLGVAESAAWPPSTSPPATAPRAPSTLPAWSPTR
mgnify:CR=1 FL=1